jgi:GntR family transcriptional repressor for pyruvate dehydrogenase complex
MFHQLGGLGDGAGQEELLAMLLRAHPETTYDYLEFRLIVAAAACRMAAERATEDDRGKLTRAYEAVVAALGRNDPRQAAEADVHFHLACYEASHNAVMLHIMRTFFLMLCHDVFYDLRQFYEREGVRQLLLRQHKAILDAILASDPQAAARAAERHIVYTREAVQESRLAGQRLAVAMRRVGRDTLAQVTDRTG